VILVHVQMTVALGLIAFHRVIHQEHGHVQIEQHDCTTLHDAFALHGSINHHNGTSCIP
jgi:hypothetical protein